MMVLSRHRPEPGHLPEQPFYNHDTVAEGMRQELAGFLREVDENGAGLEHRNRFAAVLRVVIDDRRHAVVRRKGPELRPELLALADIHRYDPVRQPGLLEKDRDLVAVRRRPIIEIDHRIPFLLARGGLSSASMFMAASERIRPIGRRDRQGCAAPNNLPVSLAPLKCRLASDSIRGRYGDHALCYFRTRPVGAKPVEPAANNGHWRVARVEKEPKTRCATEKKAAPRARRCQSRRLFGPRD